MSSFTFRVSELCCVKELRNDLRMKGGGVATKLINKVMKSLKIIATEYVNETSY